MLVSLLIKKIDCQEGNEDSHKDAHSIDSLRDDLDITALTINDGKQKTNINDMFVVKKEHFHSNYSLAPQNPNQFHIKKI